MVGSTQKGLSIKQRLILSLLLIATIILGLSSVLIYREVRSYQSLSAASEAVNVVTLLSQATIELSLERSLTQVALNLDGPIAPEINGLLQDQRQKSNALFAETRQALQASGQIAQRTVLIQRLDQYLGDIRALRQQADPLLNSPIAKRSGQQIVSIPIDIKKRVSDLDKLGYTLRTLMKEAPEQVRVTDAVIQNAWAIREYGGRERTLFAIATARQEPIIRADLAYMFENHGRALAAWDRINAEAANPDLSDAVRQGIATVGRTYFQSYDALRKDLLGTAETGAYSADFQTLFTQSEAALQTAIALLNTAAQSNQAEISQTLTASLSALVIELIIVALVVGVLIYVSTFTMGQVVRPLGEMTGAMET
ncbi:MAG: hypothetical protein ACPGYL_15355, partial [Rhodospirillaceae bacterium]